MYPKHSDPRLLHYAVSCGVFIAFTAEAQADVVYTNLDPDSVSTVGNDFFIDINNDGIDDFQFSILSTAYYATILGLPQTHCCL